MRRAWVRQCQQSFSIETVPPFGFATNGGDPAEDGAKTGDRTLRPNQQQSDTGETPLHSSLCKAPRPADDPGLTVALASGANPTLRRQVRPEIRGL